MSVVTLAPPDNPQKHKVRTYEAKQNLLILPKTVAGCFSSNPNCCIKSKISPSGVVNLTQAENFKKNSGPAAWRPNIPKITIS